MKILQTIGGFQALDGGTSTCTYNLLSAIHEIEPREKVDILVPGESNPDDSLMGIGEEWIKAVPNDYRTPLSISKNMTNFLHNSDYDIYHTNGMWMYINHSTCAIAREKKKPYVITPHGMLYPEALKRSYWKKWPLRKLWYNRDIMEASAIHATCEAEMKHIRALGYSGPIAVIGNPVYVPEYTKEIFEVRGVEPRSFWGVAFLGRLHPIKKVENLLYGVALTTRDDIKVYIIGKGDDKYEQFLKDEAQRLGLSERVEFLGFLNGFDKYAKLGLIDCLFVPSDMENFGMIVPEALIVGTPVMASLGTPWKALNDEQCGWWTDNSPEAIANVINDLISKSPEERLAMGRRGRDYILRTFAAEKVASQMIDLYHWILGESDKPEFVHTI